jgi:hypothetical protein
MVVELTIGEILDKKNITESSKKLYLSNFKRLNDGEPVQSFKFILDIDKIKSKIERFKPNTQRNYIISITSLLHDLKNINELICLPTIAIIGGIGSFIIAKQL